MKLIRKQSKTTFKSKEGKEYKGTNYFIVTEEGKKILIKPVFKEDYSILNFLSTYEK